MERKMQSIAKSLFVVFVLILAGCSTEDNSKTQEVTDKLKTFTEVIEDEDSYSFKYLNENNLSNKWTLIYSEENESVRIEDESILEFFIEIDGEDTMDGESWMAYDISDNEVRLYFDEDLAEIEILSYNLETNEYTVNQDGEKYEISKEFKEVLEENGFVELVENDVELFIEDLENNGLSLEDIKELTYDDLV